MSSIKKGSCFCKTFNCRGALQTAKKRRRHHDIDLLQEKSHTTESHMVNTSDVFENITSLYNIIHGKNKSESQPLFENSKWSKIAFTSVMLNIWSSNPGFSKDAITTVLFVFHQVMNDAGIPNCIPTSFNQAFSTVKNLLPTHEEVHVCINECTLIFFFQFYRT